MIANVAPSVLSYEDTYNTLKYATRAKEIKSAVSQTVKEKLWRLISLTKVEFYDLKLLRIYKQLWPKKQLDMTPKDKNMYLKFN